MSAIQNKLNGAYGKMAKVFGKKYQVFRPIYLNDALDAKNYVFDKQASFSVSANVVDSPSASFKQYVCYVDKGIQVGDIFKSDSEVYVIIGEPNLGAFAAVKATEVIEVWAEVVDTSGAYMNKVKTRIAKNVPATLSGASAGSEISIPNASTTSKIRYQIRVWTPQQDIRPTHSLVVNGKTLKITGIQITDLYQLISAEEV